IPQTIIFNDKKGYSAQFLMGSLQFFGSHGFIIIRMYGPGLRGCTFYHPVIKSGVVFQVGGGMASAISDSYSFNEIVISEQVQGSYEYYQQNKEPLEKKFQEFHEKHRFNKFKYNKLSVETR